MTQASLCTNNGDGDLYGLGVRLGLYLQWVAGFLLRNFSGSRATISTVRIANTVICVPIILAVVINSVRGDALSTDYLIVYYLTIALFYSESYHLLDPVGDSNNKDKTEQEDSPDYQLIPDLPLMFQNLLFASATFFGAWFWTRGFHHAKQPQCAAKAALLAVFPLDSAGWGKFAASFAIMVGLIFAFFFMVHIYGVLYGIKNGIRDRTAIGAAKFFKLASGDPITIVALLSDLSRTRLIRLARRESRGCGAQACFILLQWLLVNAIGPLIAIVSVERMLRENRLKTAGILRSSGQMIALSAGIVSLCMALWDICNRAWESKHSVDHKPPSPPENAPIPGTIPSLRHSRAKSAGSNTTRYDAGEIEARLKKTVEASYHVLGEYERVLGSFRMGPFPQIAETLSRSTMNYIWRKFGHRLNRCPSPLWWAAEKGYDNIVELLIKELPIDLGHEDQHGRTALTLATRNGHYQVIKLLLGKNGVTVDGKDDDGRTPLSWAAYRGFVASATLLIENGAEVNFRDSNGRSPLSLGAENGHLKILDLLVRSGADINLADSLGMTSLHWAMRSEQEKVVKFLQDSGAKMDTEDRTTSTPSS